MCSSDLIDNPALVDYEVRNRDPGIGTPGIGTPGIGTQGSARM